MNKIFKLTFFLFLLNIILCQSTETNSSIPSLMPFQLSPTSKPIIHIGGIEENEDTRFLTGIQLSPAKNLLIGGVISPFKTNSDISVYYHLAIGFIPEWKLFKLSSNMFQIGLHRDKFEKDGNKRWFSLSIMESGRFFNFNYNICANRLVSSVKEEDTLMMSTNIKLKNSIYLRPGIIAFLPKFDYNPFLLLSIKL